METSYYIIKPHGMVFREKVRKMIEGAGLVIAESKIVVMDGRALEIIYSDLDERFRRVVFQLFRNTPVEMALVTGKNAIDALLEIAGTELDPVDCAPNSIRFMLGGRRPLMIDGVRCYVNIIHRPRNQSEAEKGIELFRIL